MQELLQTIVADATAAVAGLRARGEFEAVKARFVGPNGALTQALKQMGRLPKEERPAFGKLVNETKGQLEALFARVADELANAELRRKLGPAEDLTLPATGGLAGCAHVLTSTRRRLVEIFRRAGFSVAEGSEAETEYYCFDALNTPPEHPARDLQDTYYFPAGTRISNVSQKAGERYLLRTHTSSVQIRTMLAQTPPVRIVAPGRCYRRDTVDATHSASFHQIEGLYVDREVSVRDLKALLDYFFKSLLGDGAETRFRPHFFPYTEPSFEVDVRLPNFGKLSGRWVEIMGCGMVDPEVFAAVGYDPAVWRGYAFGMGIERLAMTLHGIDDIRHFYANDARFLRQFA